MSFSAYGTNKRDYDLMTESLTTKSLDGNFKTLKVMDADVLTGTDVSGKLDSSAVGDKSLDGNFATLKVNDVSVVTDVSGKLDSSTIGDKSLDGNFKTLKVMDADAITDVSGKLDNTGGTISGTLGVNDVLTAGGGLTLGNNKYITHGTTTTLPVSGQLGYMNPTSSATVNLGASGSVTNVTSKSLVAGTWLILARFGYGNGGGTTSITQLRYGLGNTNNAYGLDMGDVQLISAGSIVYPNAQTFPGYQLFYIHTSATSNTIYFNTTVHYSGGTTNNCTVNYRLIRLA